MITRTTGCWVRHRLRFCHRRCPEISAITVLSQDRIVTRRSLRLASVGVCRQSVLEVSDYLKSWIASCDRSDTMSVIEDSQTENSDVFRGNDEADVNTGKNGQDFHGCYCSSETLSVRVDRFSVPMETISVQSRMGSANVFRVVI